MNKAEILKITEEIDFLEYQIALIDDSYDTFAYEKREEIYERLDYLEWVLLIGEQTVIMEQQKEKRKHLTLINGEKE